jgi:hypothetical protein
MKHLVRRLLLTIVLLSVGSYVASAQELLSNGTFDTDIDGWTLSPGISTDGTIDWEVMQGLPPGSLRFSNGAHVALPQECFGLQLGVFNFNTDVFMETSGDFIPCHINYYLYTDSECESEFAYFIDLFPIVTSMNEWENLEFNLPIDQNTVDNFPFPYIRPVIGKGGGVNDVEACLFDNVSFQFVPEAPGPSSIPALSTTGMALLATLLAIAGIGVVRRSFVRS